jgi:Putative Flp pilus-assembly TadE/G-like
MATFCLVAMIGMIGLVTDLGWAHFVRLKAQAAADAAAVAGAEFVLTSAGQSGTIACGAGIVCQSETGCPGSLSSPPTSNVQAACLYAQANGFVNRGNQKVTVASGTSSPPPTASGVHVSYWLTVRVSESVPQFFSAVLGNTTATVAARATGGLVGSSGSPCVYSLAPTGNNTLVASGGSQVNIGCGIVVDSTGDQALVSSGGSCITANSVKVAGNWSGDCVTPAPVTGASPAADPYASSPAPPTYSGCDYTNFSVNTSQTIHPGVYCNGIVINSGNIIVASGTYILDGGGLTINTTASAVTGTNVTFYNTADGTHSFQPIKIQGGASVTLSAPTTGPLAGMLFFQDRSISSVAKNQVSGGSSVRLTGILYFPTTELDFTGGSSNQETYMSIVAKIVQFTGDSNFKNYNILLNPLAARSAALVE